MNVIVTGGAGFIGGNLILELLKISKFKVLNIDKLSYASNFLLGDKLEQEKNYQFCHLNICDYKSLEKQILKFKPNYIMHLAAESHVDRSISGPWTFIESNIIGTYNMLEASRRYYELLNSSDRESFKFLHVSTDEVYGDLEIDEYPFTELNRYVPSSPYSASKASSDHLVRAWHRTYGLPTIITNCSNNYGPYQHPEKLIPNMILRALNGNSLPIYGDGKQIRDWLYVNDHVDALIKVITEGLPGDTYNIGGCNEIANIEVVHQICTFLSEYTSSKINYKSLITFVEDRPGHDKRYAINAKKIQKNLGWKPKENFKTGLSKTVKWYLENTTRSTDSKIILKGQKI